MTLNNFVTANVLYHEDRLLNVKFKNTIADEHQFSGIFGNKGSLKTQPNTQGIQNDLMYKNEEGFYNVISNAPQRVFQQLSPQFTITNNNVETSLISTLNGIGSPTIPANSLRKGSKIIMEGHGRILTTNSNVQCQFRAYSNTTLLLDSNLFLLPNLSSASDYEYKIETILYGQGDTVEVRTHGHFNFVDTQGNTHTFFYDFTEDLNFSTEEANTIDVTWEWSSAGNHTLTVYQNSISKIV